MLQRIARNRPVDKRIMLEEISAVHSAISELYEIFGDRKRADRHFDMSIQAENGILPDY